MKVYISSHSIDDARRVADAVTEAGHSVVSNWHLGSQPMKRTADMAEEEMRDKSRANEGNIELCDVLVLIASDDMVPGGKFVEAGIAIGKKKRVVILGRYENMLLRHPRVVRVDTIEDLLVIIK